MDHLELLQRLSVSLAIGLLIGIERGRTMLSEAEGERTAGLRTLALTGLLGGISAVLAQKFEAGGVVLAVMFLAYAAIMGLYRFREVQHRKTYGMTTVIAGLVTFALGALAIVVEPLLAAAAAVAVTALLAMKSALHGWLKALTWEELRAGLILLAMSVILLPVLPDKGFGPLEALNPYDIWRMTVLIAAVSSLGYLAMKWVGGDHGIAISGLAGGLVSSTAVTLSFSRLAREHPQKEAELAAGALLASTVMMGRILLVSGSIQPMILSWLLLPLGLAGLALGAVALFQLRSHYSDRPDQPLELKSPFELGNVLKFSAFLAAIMIVAKALTAWVGSSGAYALAAVSGIADVDAVTLTFSRLVGEGLTAETASYAILIAAGVNTVSKAVIGWVAGGRGPGLRLVIGAFAAIAGGILGVMLAAMWDPMEVYNSLPSAT